MDKIKKIIIGIFLFTLVVVVFIVFKAGKTFLVIKGSRSNYSLQQGSEIKLHDDPNRINIAVFGIRGKNDPNGGLLTDTILLVSYKMDNSKAAIVSIPRDIYIKDYPGLNKGEKLNAAYVLGEEQQRGYGIEYAKMIVAGVTGVKIHYGLVVNFKAFEDLIDTLGGIDVLVEKPLRETLQWGGMDFYVPAGRQYMDGKKALYYSRSRFTTSDFDRGRRQQEVIMAIRDKALRLGILANPFKINKIFNIIEKNVKTDIDFMKMIDLLALTSKIPPANIRHEVIDNTENGFLYSSKIGDIYVLLPKGGNFNRVREMIKNILD